MVPSLSAARRRLGLGAGALLAASALALPAAASASVTVAPATTTEGNSGTTVAVTAVEMNCPAHHCDYELALDYGTASPAQLTFAPFPALKNVPSGVTQAKFSVSITGDTEQEPNMTYGLQVKETRYDNVCPACLNDPIFKATTEGRTYLAGTIVDDDTAAPGAGNQQGNPAPVPGDDDRDDDDDDRDDDEDDDDDRDDDED